MGEAERQSVFDAENPVVRMITANEGSHNKNLEEEREHVVKGRLFEDLSTVSLTLKRDRWAHDFWMGPFFNMQPAPNQKLHRVVISGMSIDDGYNKTLEDILKHPIYQSSKYLLTYEEDNIPPHNGLNLLHSSINGGVDGIKYDVMGGLYWSKNKNGVPLILGDPSKPGDTCVQAPVIDGINECNVAPMGFTLFRMDLFRDERFPRPWFQTSWSEREGERFWVSQDSFFCQNARKLGYRIGIDTRVKVGHLDFNTEIVY